MYMYLYIYLFMKNTKIIPPMSYYLICMFYIFFKTRLGQNILHRNSEPFNAF